MLILVQFVEDDWLLNGAGHPADLDPIISLIGLTVTGSNSQRGQAPMQWTS